MVPSVGVDETLDPQALLELCRTAEALGFAAVTVTDHPAPLRRSPRHTGLDPFAALACIGAVTTRLRLHTGALVLPYRNPFLVAQGAATVQLLSGGRLILGVGTGYLREEFAALGVPAENRGRLMEEGLEMLQAAFRGERIRLAGEEAPASNVSVPTIAAYPPPLWVGGNGPRARTRAVRWADGWMPFEAPPDTKAESRPPLDAAGLAPLVAALRRRTGRRGRRGALEVCFVRPMPTWLEATAGRIEEELGQLRDAAVDWIVLRPPGEELVAIVEGARRFAEIAGLSADKQ